MTLRGLLTDEPLSGTVGLHRRVTPQVYAHLVDATSLADTTSVIRHACDLWGGAYHPLIPVEPGAGAVADPWATLLTDARPAVTAARDLAPKPEPRDRPKHGGLWVDEIGGLSPLEVLARSGRGVEDRWTVSTANGLPLDDPWAVAYLGVRGLMPEPGESNVDPLSRYLTPGDTYDDYAEVDRARPDEPGHIDLLRQLQAGGTITASRLSCLTLGLFPAPLGSQFGTKPQIPLRFETARECGPNVVVVYEPGSVVDLCLLWHLRSAHALPPGLPLAVPVTADVPAALRHFELERAFSRWGFRDTAGHLVSASVASSDLAAIAVEAGRPWSAVDWPDLLQPSRGVGTLTADVAVFDAGRATISTLVPEERTKLEPGLTSPMGRFDLEVFPVNQPLPPSPSLTTMPMVSEFRMGPVHEVSGGRETIAVRWPTGLTVLKAVVRDRGMTARPSEPGRLAEALLTNCDEAGGIEPLLHTGATGLLQRVSERHGMNWFKRTLQQIHASGPDAPQDAEERLARVEERVRHLAGPGNSDEQHDITYNDAQQVFRDRATTEAWLAWADRAGLLLRGTRITCERCANNSWRPMTDLAPPITCFGCGHPIARPYGYDQLKFRFRATELLLQAAKSDTIVHALSLRYFIQLLQPSSNRISSIYGGYPGITFKQPGDADPAGEADVLFVLADGRVGIGECKTRAAGLTDQELRKLTELADRLEAAFTFVATLDRSSECGPTWRQDPGGTRPHFALTAEHLLEISPANVMSNDPFGWRIAFSTSMGNGDDTPQGHDARAAAAIKEIDAWERRGRTPWFQQNDPAEN